MNLPLRHTPRPTRRDFLKTSSAIAAFAILPARAWSQSPNSRLQVACVGVGNQGGHNLKTLARLPNVDVVALCDVDRAYLRIAAALHPEASTFSDYRVLLDRMGSKIDALLVSTPDHMHAPISLAALQQGKHVYCEKPLGHSVGENRLLADTSQNQGLVTQLGIQVSSSIAQRLTVEYVRRGLLGKVSQVHVWSDKQWGMDSPLPPLGQPDPIPSQLSWHLWLGVAPARPYKLEHYHPLNWRKFIDFGTGTLGDMGVHIFHTAYKALELQAPRWVRAECRPPNGVTHPMSARVEYAFAPTRFTTKNLLWVWHDGEYAPPKGLVEELRLPADTNLPAQGCLIVGEQGSLLLPHGSGPQTFPADLIKSIPRPELEPIDHHAQWVNACLGAGQCDAPFSYGGPLCEALQLGVIACRFPERKLAWKPSRLRISRPRAANAYLDREYRLF